MALKKPIHNYSGDLKELQSGDLLNHSDVDIGRAALTDGATITCDISLGQVFDITLAGNRTITFTGGSAATDGKKIIVRIKQDATGSRLLTWDTIVRFGTDITGITLTTTANATDMVGLIYNHAATKFDVVAFSRGY